MVTPTCPKCRAVIPSEDVNVTKDVAYCRACNLSHELSLLTHGGGSDIEVDLAHPPPGAWYRNEGMGPVVGATHRSVGAAVGSLLFGLFWNGIVSVFVVFAIAGTLRNLDIPLPHWFPAPNMNGNPMGVGMTLFLWIFLTPFILVGLAMIAVFLSSLAGRSEVRISGAEGIQFTGIGPVGFRRRFEPSTVKDIRIEDKQWRDSDGDRRRKAQIIIETREGKLIKFGSMLTDDRRRFVAGASRKVIKR